MEAQPKGILIALGEGWEKGRHGTRRRLSHDSVVTTRAMHQLLKTGDYQIGIISTGRTNGANQEAEADVMGNLLATFPDQSNVPVLREIGSYDTPTNLQMTDVLIRENHLKGSRTVVAPYNHLPRVQQLADNFGIPITTIAAEKVLGIPNGRRRLREVLLTPLLVIDPKGKLPGLLSRRRPR